MLVGTSSLRQTTMATTGSKQIMIGMIFITLAQLPNIWMLFTASIPTISGILLLYQPSFLMNELNASNTVSLNPYGVILSLLCGLSRTVACILIRRAKKSHVLQLGMVYSLRSIILWVPLLSVINQFTLKDKIIGSIFDITMLTHIDDIHTVGILFIVGILGFAGTLFMTLGYQSGEATKVSWLDYIVIPFSFGYQILFFKDVPSQHQIIVHVKSRGINYDARLIIYKYVVYMVYSHRIQIAVDL